MTELTGGRADLITALIGDVPPATDRLVKQLAETVQGRRDHEHPNHEDFYCFNQVSWAGERVAYVLRRLLDAEAEVVRLRAELAEERKTPTERANDRVRALREAGDLEGALAVAEANEASVAHDVTHPRI